MITAEQKNDVASLMAMTSDEVASLYTKNWEVVFRVVADQFGYDVSALSEEQQSDLMTIIADIDAVDGCGLDAAAAKGFSEYVRQEGGPEVFGLETE